MTEVQAGPIRSLPMLNRTFCEGDNLEFLLRMPDASVDLIATDPPFNKNKEFQGIGKAEGANFKDYWSWEDDVHRPYLDHIARHWPALNEVVEAAYIAHSPSMAAFLSFMSVRLIEMHRILKPTGSLYLHCDPTANAYLRLMLDSIFGMQNLLGEIVWNKGNGVKSKTSWGNENDNILCYAKKAGTHVFNSNDPVCRKPFADISRSMHFNKVDTDGRRYRERVINGKSYIYYEDEGRFIGNLWNDIPSMQANTPLLGEYTGWKTQKPLALYQRIVKTSSQPEDLVLDPFAGCATTCVAAEQTGRQWIGIDLSPKARGITLDRLKKEAGEGTFWENAVHLLVAADLPPLPQPEDPDDEEDESDSYHALVARYLSVPSLPARAEGGTGAPKKGYKPEDVRRYLAVREASGTHIDMNLACQGCGYTPPRLEYQDIDHIVPRAQGGKNNWDNLCLLCPPCNRRKAHKLTVDELRAFVQTGSLLLDASKLMVLDAKSIAKRDRAMRPS